MAANTCTCEPPGVLLRRGSDSSLSGTEPETAFPTTRVLMVPGASASPAAQWLRRAAGHLPGSCRPVLEVGTPSSQKVSDRLCGQRNSPRAHVDRLYTGAVWLSCPSVPMSLPRKLLLLSRPGPRWVQPLVRQQHEEPALWPQEPSGGPCPCVPLALSPASSLSREKEGHPVFRSTAVAIATSLFLCRTYPARGRPSPRCLWPRVTSSTPRVPRGGGGPSHSGPSTGAGVASPVRGEAPARPQERRRNQKEVFCAF